MAARRYSRQREMIKEFLCARKDHPTADMVYKNVQMLNPHISLGTVYRNLTLLSESGEISRLHLGDGVDHFDADTSPHCHFICRQCGQVTDLENQGMEELISKASAGFDGRITGCMAYFYGICRHCSGTNE